MITSHQITTGFTNALKPVANNNSLPTIATSVPDPDLEIRGVEGEGGGGVLCGLQKHFWIRHWTYDCVIESFCSLTNRARLQRKVSSRRFGVYQDCLTPWSSVLVHLFVGFPKQCLSPVGRKSRWRSLRFEWNSQQPRCWPYEWHPGNCSCSKLVHYNFHRGRNGGCSQ